MPVEYIKNVSSGQILGLWKIKETEEQLKNNLSLSEEEKIQFQSLNNEKRKLSWLAVRNLLLQMPDINHNINYDHFGAPFLNPGRHISISHSGDYAAIIISKTGKTGIDIELINPKILSLLPKFLNDDEYADVLNNVEKAYIYWCAKEALYKYYGRKELIFKENLLVQPFDYQGKGLISGEVKKEGPGISIKLYYQKVIDYMLVYTLND